MKTGIIWQIIGVRVSNDQGSPIWGRGAYVRGSNEMTLHLELPKSRIPPESLSLHNPEVEPLNV